MLGNERSSAGNDGIGGGCTTLWGCSTPIECDATGRKSPQQDRSHKLWREANGGAQCGKSARCVRRGGGWRRGVGRDPRATPARQPDAAALHAQAQKADGAGADERFLPGRGAAGSPRRVTPCVTLG